MRYDVQGGLFNGIPTVVKNLLIINGLVFLFKLLNPFAQITGDLDDLLGLHFITSPLFKPWQLLTHMFMHGGWGHILLNMLGLFMLGPRVEYRWGSQRFLTYYLLCGLGSAVLYMGWQWFGARHALAAISGADLINVRDTVVQGAREGLEYTFNNPAAQKVYTLWHVPMVGASGALFGILVAFGMLYPNVELTTFVYFIPINMKAKWFVAMYAAVELFSGVANAQGDNTAHFAHIGGLIAGFFLVRYYEKKNMFFDDHWR